MLKTNITDNRWYVRIFLTRPKLTPKQADEWISLFCEEETDSMKKRIKAHITHETEDGECFVPRILSKAVRMILSIKTLITDAVFYYDAIALKTDSGHGYYLAYTGEFELSDDDGNRVPFFELTRDNRLSIFRSVINGDYSGHITQLQGEK